MNDLRRLTLMLRPHRGWMALSVALLLVSALANIGLIAVAGWFVSAMGVAGAAGTTMNYFAPAAVIRALAMLRTGGRYGERVVSHEATLRLLAGLRTWLYEQLEPLAPQGLQGLRSGDLLARMRTDVDRLETVFLRLLAPAMVALAASAVVVAVLASYLPLLGLVQAVFLACAGLLLPFIVMRAGAGPSERITVGSAELSSTIVDTADGLAELQAYGQAERRFDRIVRLSDDLIADERRLQRLSSLSQAGIGLFGNIALLCAALIVVPAIRSRVTVPADLAMLVLLAFTSFEAIAPVAAAFQSLSGTLASARRIFAIADQRPPIAEPVRPATLQASTVLAFDNVCLHYPGANRSALCNFDLTLWAGRRVAVIGTSGSGKSSLVNLALRFWEPNSGSITLDTIPLADLKSDEVRARFSVLTQDPHLFAATIEENLRIARPNASLAELEEACRIAQIHDFIASQPDGYRTYVGTNGMKLSGGQARRLAVARVLLKDATFLLLDEPTEGMDAEGAQALLNSVLAARPEAGILLITHGNVGLALMDEIVVLDEGRVLARGPHATILEKLSRRFDTQIAISEASKIDH